MILRPYGRRPHMWNVSASPMTSGRVLGYMVVRNERARYLDACLAWAAGVVDDLGVYDDRSDDGTAALARARGALVAVREEHAPSFLDHEGRFRADAWAWFEAALAPAEGDWVLALDADEFVVSSHGTARDGVDRAVAEAGRLGAITALVAVPEVFATDVDDTGYLVEARVRVDGLWGTIAGTRLFAYRPGGIFRDRAMGCGAEPTYVASAARGALQAGWLRLLHLGYADAEDRQAKYDRYTALANHGHADDHVRSILAPATVRPWRGPWPPIWRGVRP